MPFALAGSAAASPNCVIHRFPHNRADSSYLSVERCSEVSKTVAPRVYPLCPASASRAGTHNLVSPPSEYRSLYLELPFGGAPVRRPL